MSDAHEFLRQNLSSLDQTLQQHEEADMKTIEDIKNVEVALKFMDHTGKLKNGIEKWHKEKKLSNYLASINIYRLGEMMYKLRRRFDQILCLKFKKNDEKLKAHSLKKLEKKFKQVITDIEHSYLNIDHVRYEELDILELKPKDLSESFDKAYEEFYRSQINKLKSETILKEYYSACRRLHIFDKIVHKMIANEEYYKRMDTSPDLQYLKTFISNNYELAEYIRVDNYLRTNRSIEKILEYVRFIFDDHKRFFRMVADNKYDSGKVMVYENIKRELNNLRIKLDLVNKHLDELFVSNYEKSITPRLQTDLGGGSTIESEFYGNEFNERNSENEMVIRSFRDVKPYDTLRRDLLNEEIKALTDEKKGPHSNLLSYLNLKRRLYFYECAMDRCMMLQYPILFEEVGRQLEYEIINIRNKRLKVGYLTPVPNIDNLQYTDLQREREKIRNLNTYEEYLEYDFRLFMEFFIFQLQVRDEKSDKNYIRRKSNELRIIIYEFNKKIAQKIDEAFVDRFFEPNNTQNKVRFFFASKMFSFLYVKNEEDEDDDDSSSDNEDEYLSVDSDNTQLRPEEIEDFLGQQKQEKLNTGFILQPTRSPTYNQPLTIDVNYEPQQSPETPQTPHSKFDLHNTKIVHFSSTPINEQKLKPTKSTHQKSDSDNKMDIFLDLDFFVNTKKNKNKRK